MFESIGPEKLFDVAALEKAINTGLDDQARRAAQNFRSHMATWSPRSKATVGVKKSADFSREIRARGGKLRFVEFDTKPHIIVPKKSQVLVFKSRYKRKTSGKRIASNRGGSYGDTVFSKQVKHPGSQGTQISKQIKTKIDKKLAPAIQQEINKVNRVV